MNKEEAEKKYLEYLEGHIDNVKSALDILISLDIPFINDNKNELLDIVSKHDESKYEDPEWTAYLHHWYPTSEEDSLKTEEYEAACKHHIENNPHHWDYWVKDGKLIDDIDEHEYKLYTVERLCDHMAMSIQNDNKPNEWYYANKENIIMPDYGYSLYEEMLEKIPDDYDLPFHGTRTDGKPERDEINEDALEEHLLGLNKKYIKKLGKRAKLGNNGTVVSIKPNFSNMTFDDVIESFKKEENSKLSEYGNSGYVGNRKSIRAVSAESDNKFPATTAAKYLGVNSQAIKDILSPSEWHHTGSYYNETDYYDIDLLIGIKNKDDSILSNYSDEEIEEAKEQYNRLKQWKKPEVKSNTFKADIEWLTWSGTRKYPKATKHVLKNVDVEERGSFYYFKDEDGNEIKKKIGSNGTIVNRLSESLKTVFLEAKMSQLKNKTKSEDPARVRKSRNVKSTYLGMSKFGILNFKTTSESRPGGHHYQTVEFQSMKPLEDVIKKNGKVMPLDIKNLFENGDINVFCTDESFSYWAWYYQAYQNDYAYIDDNIPNLDKRIQAPKVNNVRLAGALCKHLYSVLDYMMKPFVLLAISDDVNKYLNKEEDKYHKQTAATQNWYDAVKQWGSEDATDYIGMTREQIVADLSKTIKIDNTISLEDYVDDLVKDKMRQDKKNDPRLEKIISDKIIDELNLEDEYNKIKPEEVNDENTK